jgi:hypothetical protein
MQFDVQYVLLGPSGSIITATSHIVARTPEPPLLLDHKP